MQTSLLRSEPSSFTHFSKHLGTKSYFYFCDFLVIRPSAWCHFCTKKPVTRIVLYSLSMVFFSLIRTDYSIPILILTNSALLKQVSYILSRWTIPIHIFASYNVPGRVHHPLGLSKGKLTGLTICFEIDV